MTAFDKYEGLGNDFVVIDAADESEVPTARASTICDRHFGVGADGVLLVLPPRRPDCDARMRVINADGSVPEMCGNGVRCVAIRLARARGQTAGAVRIDTDAGPCACEIIDGDGQGSVTVDMGVVRVLGERIVDVDGQRLALVEVDAGNPHAVLFGVYDRSEVERFGSRLAVHPAFPRGTNVEFARPASTGIDLVVWERGVGITLACGTGACAAAAAAWGKGLAAEGAPLPIRLPGGRLDITTDGEGRVMMRGPARRVFSGTLAM